MIVICSLSSSLIPNLCILQHLICFNFSYNFIFFYCIPSRYKRWLIGLMSQTKFFNMEITFCFALGVYLYPIWCLLLLQTLQTVVYSLLHSPQYLTQVKKKITVNFGKSQWLTHFLFQRRTLCFAKDRFSSDKKLIRFLLHNRKYFVHCSEQPTKCEHEERFPLNFLQPQKLISIGNSMTCSGI